MKIAIIGAGINGLCVAGEALKKGHEVEIFERGHIMGETSSNSSKLLHGGLRYLENGEFRLVREALKEREYWINLPTEHSRWIRIYFPISKSSKRSKWVISLGLTFYDWFSNDYLTNRHRKESINKFQEIFPDFATDNLKAVYSYIDGQMDDEKLGQWFASQLLEKGCKINENMPVESVDSNGTITLCNGSRLKYDKVINVAGPWSQSLLNKSNIHSSTRLDLIRGSHIILNRNISAGLILESSVDARIFFVLPYKEKTLIGTTEIRQEIEDKIEVSDEEIEYLLSSYNSYFKRKVSKEDIIESYAGLRPLICSHNNPSKVSREYVIESCDHLISVFGGKWTTARALGEKLVEKYL